MQSVSNQPQRHPSSRTFPHWSPDGSKILVDIGRRPAIVDRDLTHQTELGPEDTWVTYPDWSPDGERVTYAWRGLHGDQTEPHWGIYSSKPDGSDVQMMTSTGWRGQWSPDGQKLAFHLVKQDAPIRLAVMNRDGTSETVLATEPRIGGMSWSPDSKTLVYENWDFEGGQLYTMDIETHEKTRLLPDSDGSDKSAQSSPDGKKVVFERFHSPGRRTELRVLDLETGQDRTLAAPHRSNHDAAWSPDGQRLVFTSNTTEGDFNLYLVDADGSNLQQLTSTPGDEYAPAWSPDGHSIAFYHQEEGAEKSLKVVDL